MPTPAYVGTVNGEAALVLREDIPLAGDQEYIAWDKLSENDQLELVDNVFDIMDGEGPIAADGTGPFPGAQYTEFDPTTVGGTATGLIATQTYGLGVEVDGTPVTGSFLGSAASTFTDLLTEINTILGVAATAVLSPGAFTGFISIVSATTGSASLVNITNGDVLTQTAGYNGYKYPLNGGADLFEVVDLSIRTPGSPWRTQFSMSSFGPSASPVKGVLKANLIAGSPSPVGSDGNWVYVPDQAPPTYVFSDGIAWIDIRTGVALV